MSMKMQMIVAQFWLLSICSVSFNTADEIPVPRIIRELCRLLKEWISCENCVIQDCHLLNRAVINFLIQTDFPCDISS